MKTSNLILYETPLRHMKFDLDGLNKGKRLTLLKMAIY